MQIDIANRIPNKEMTFWMQIAAIILLLLGIIAYAHSMVSGSKLTTARDGKPVIIIKWAKELGKLVPDLITKQADVFSKSQSEVDTAIEKRVNEAFAPVYAQVPKLMDFHYSLKGEYTEIVSYIAGSFAEGMKKILFNDVQFKKKLEQAGSRISSDTKDIIAPALSEFRSHISTKLKLSKADADLLGAYMSFSVEGKLPDNSVISKLQKGGLVHFVSARIVSRLSKMMAEKLAIKAGIKIGGLGSAAGTGALVCSPGGPIASAGCAIVFAGSAWVASDYIIIKADEKLNRKSFETKVKVMIDSSKEAVIKKIKDRYQMALKKVEASNRSILEYLPARKTPAEMNSRR